MKRLSDNLVIIDAYVTKEMGREMPSCADDSKVREYIVAMCRWISPLISFEKIQSKETEILVMTTPEVSQSDRDLMVRVSRGLFPTEKFTRESSILVTDLGMHFGEMARRACVDTSWQIHHNDTHGFNYFALHFGARRRAEYSCHNFTTHSLGWMCSRYMGMRSVMFRKPEGVKHGKPQRAREVVRISD